MLTATPKDAISKTTQLSAVFHDHWNKTFFWNIQNSTCFALWIPQDVAQYLSIIDYRVSSFKRLKIMFLCNFKIMMFLIVKIFMTYIEFGFFLIQLFSFLFTDLQRRNLSTNEQSLRWHSWLSWSGACCPFACCKHNQGQISIHLYFHSVEHSPTFPPKGRRAGLQSGRIPTHKSIQVKLIFSLSNIDICVNAARTVVKTKIKGKLSPHVEETFIQDPATIDFPYKKNPCHETNELFNIAVFPFWNLKEDLHIFAILNLKET